MEIPLSTLEQVNLPLSRNTFLTLANSFSISSYQRCLSLQTQSPSCSESRSLSLNLAFFQSNMRIPGIKLGLLALQALQFAPALGDYLEIWTCHCEGLHDVEYFDYKSQRLHLEDKHFRNVTDLAGFHNIFREYCWKIKEGNHEFCYNPNFIAADTVRLDSPKKKKLPRRGKGKGGYQALDCTWQCREYYGLESACNQTWQLADTMQPDGTLKHHYVAEPFCPVRTYNFEDL